MKRIRAIVRVTKPKWVALMVERVENGEVSPYLVDEIRIGDQFELRGPIGGYFVWTVAMGGPLCLIAAGSGIAPLMAMLRHRDRQSAGVPSVLLFSARSIDDVIYGKELDAMARRDPDLSVVGLDATGSRRRAWDMAASLTAGMFREAAAIGSLDLQLVYYRGEKECRASGWVSDADRLVKMMARIECEAGETQIERILAHAIKETTKLKVGALVFVGDAMEENLDILVARARELGRLGTPAFMFQEGGDPAVASAFRDIAAGTGGAYAKFDAGAARQLGELLRAVAAFVVGGVQALEGRKDRESMLLLEQIKKGGAQ
jgi:Oxidoreductase NAD-binding domain